MKTHQKVFLSLVRNSLWDTQVKVPVGFNEWGLVMRLASSQAMEGNAAKALLETPDILERMKPESKLRLSNMLMTNVVMHSMTNSSIQSVVSALDDAGIRCVLLKGQGMAANYRHPEVRDCGDIDLYVGVENYCRSYEVLKEVTDHIDDASVLNGNGKHYHAQLSGICIEVHRYYNESASSAMDMSQNFVEMEFGDVKVMTPADDFNSFFVFSHLWRHFISVGVGLRQICDWVMFLHKRGQNVDKGHLRKMLTDMKLMTPWKTFGCIAVDILGLPADEFPFYDANKRKAALKVLERIFQEGDMGRGTEFIRVADRGYLTEKLFSLKFYIKRFCGLAPLFPLHAFRQLCSSVKSGFLRLLGEH